MKRNYLLKEWISDVCFVLLIKPFDWAKNIFAKISLLINELFLLSLSFSLFRYFSFFPNEIEFYEEFLLGKLQSKKFLFKLFLLFLSLPFRCAKCNNKMKGLRALKLRARNDVTIKRDFSRICEKETFLSPSTIFSSYSSIYYISHRSEAMIVSERNGPQKVLKLLFIRKKGEGNLQIKFLPYPKLINQFAAKRMP